MTGRLGLAACLGAEVLAGACGFAATVHAARRLGPSGLASLEVAAAVAGWVLVLVRGGPDQIVIREAARHPRLVAPLTDLLLGLRCLWCGAGLAILWGVLSWTDAGRSAPLLAAAMVLIPSALVADVGPRARVESGFLAGLGLLRAVGVMAAIVTLVNRPDDLPRAAIAPALGESLVAAACLVRALRAGHRPRPRFRKRAAIVVSRRATMAGGTRFLRVGLYGADAMALGLISGAAVGTYAAGRRLTFALVAVGIVVPSLLAPALARAWKAGRDRASAEVGRGASILLGLFVPASIGLILTADRVLPWLFGPDYGDGSAGLVPIAIRLPLLLLATWFQAALVAIGREGRALSATAIVAGLAAIVLPLAAIGWGTLGIGWTVLGVEAIAAGSGYLSLRRAGVEPIGGLDLRPIAVGCLAMGLVVAATRSGPFPIVCLAGALAYGAAWAIPVGGRRLALGGRTR